MKFVLCYKKAYKFESKSGLAIKQRCQSQIQLKWFLANNSLDLIIKQQQQKISRSQKHYQKDILLTIMHNPYQQPPTHHQHQSPRFLSYSMVSSSPSHVSIQQSKLPPISQPMISRYRNQRLPTNLFTSNKSFLRYNFLSEIFCGKESECSESMCSKCERSNDLELCSFVLEMVEEKYDWREDVKFRSSYEFYNKKKISIFLTDQEIQHRIMSKFSILGVVLLDNHKLLLMRIIKNYLKHTVYYGQQHKLTQQNDYYFWFLIGIYYHVGVPKYFNQLQSLPKDSVGLHEPIMFWMLDMVMQKLKDCSQAKIRAISELTLQYCQFFYQRECKALAVYDINLLQLMYQWTNEGMMGYMGIQFIGFYIKSLLKEGYQYMQKTVMSYFEKRVVKLDRDQIMSFNHQGNDSRSSNNNLLKNNICSSNIPSHLNGFQPLSGTTMSEETKKAKKQQILKVLLDSNEEWPGIFFSTNVYDLKK